MSSKRPTRRRFLQSQAAVREEAAERATAEPPSGSEAASPPTRAVLKSPLSAERSLLMTSVRRRAMACDWEVQLSAHRDDDSMEHVFAALDLVEALEDQMTIYRDDSEVIRINRQAADGPVAVEPRLFTLLQWAARLHDETWGALDITSGPLSDAWGFSRRRGRVPSDDAITAALERVGMDHVALDEATRTIAFRRPGVAINFNSIGKGYALDRMAERLAEGGVDDFLLHGGKSSVLARGNQPGAAQRTESTEHGVPRSSPLPASRSLDSAPGWIVGLRHPLRSAERLAEFYLRDQALATSGAATQFFRRRGRSYGHILDPRTGRPAEGIYSATVIAPTAAEADALSTAFYVMGPEQVADYCAARPELSALLVCPAEREGGVRLHAFGLDDEWRQVG